MQPSSEIIDYFKSNPWAALALMILFFLMRWTLNNIKIDHLSNFKGRKLKHLKEEITSNLFNDDEKYINIIKETYKSMRYQKITGISNRNQQEVIMEVIRNSKTITSYRYFSSYRNLLDWDNENLFISHEKCKKNNKEFFIFFAMSFFTSIYGAIIWQDDQFLSGILFLFCVLFLIICIDRITPGRKLRDAAQAEIDSYYLSRI